MSSSGRGGGRHSGRGAPQGGRGQSGFHSSGGAARRPYENGNPVSRGDAGGVEAAGAAAAGAPAAAPAISAGAAAPGGWGKGPSFASIVSAQRTSAGGGQAQPANKSPSPAVVDAAPDVKTGDVAVNGPAKADVAATPGAATAPSAPTPAPLQAEVPAVPPPAPPPATPAVQAGPAAADIQFGTFTQQPVAGGAKEPATAQPAKVSAAVAAPPAPPPVNPAIPSAAPVPAPSAQARGGPSPKPGAAERGKQGNGRPASATGSSGGGPVGRAPSRGPDTAPPPAPAPPPALAEPPVAAPAAPLPAAKPAQAPAPPPAPLSLPQAVPAPNPGMPMNQGVPPGGLAPGAPPMMAGVAGGGAGPRGADHRVASSGGGGGPYNGRVPGGQRGGGGGGPDSRSNDGYHGPGHRGQQHYSAPSRGGGGGPGGPGSHGQHLGHHAGVPQGMTHITYHPHAMPQAPGPYAAMPGQYSVVMPAQPMYSYPLPPQQFGMYPNSPPTLGHHHMMNYPPMMQAMQHGALLHGGMQQGMGAPQPPPPQQPAPPPQQQQQPPPPPLPAGPGGGPSGGLQGGPAPRGSMPPGAQHTMQPGPRVPGTAAHGGAAPTPGVGQVPAGGAMPAPAAAVSGAGASYSPGQPGKSHSVTIRDKEGNPIDLSSLHKTAGKASAASGPTAAGLVAPPAAPATPAVSKAREIKLPPPEMLARYHHRTQPLAAPAAAPAPAGLATGAPATPAPAAPVAAAAPDAPTPQAASLEGKPVDKIEPQAEEKAVEQKAEQQEKAAPVASPVVSTAPGEPPAPHTPVQEAPTLAAEPVTTAPVTATAPEPSEATAVQAEAVQPPAPSPAPVAEEAPVPQPTAVAVAAPEQQPTTLEAQPTLDAQGLPSAVESLATVPEDSVLVPPPVMEASAPVAAAEAPAASRQQLDTSPVAATAQEAEAMAAAAADVAAATPAAIKKKHSIKDVGKRGDARDDELRDLSDPFAAKPKPSAPTAGLEAKPEAAPKPPSAQPSPERRPISAQGTAEQGKEEPAVSDNWEATAEQESPSATSPAPPGQPAEEGGKKRRVYTRDFLRSRAPGFTTRPVGLELTHYANEMVLHHPRPFDLTVQSFELTSQPSLGRRGGGGGGGGGPSGGGARGGPAGMPSDDWGMRRAGPDRGAFSQEARPSVPGGGSGPRGAPLGRTRSAQVEDKWERRGPPPSPGDGRRSGRGDPMSRGPSGLLPSLHRTENRFVVGQVQGDDPEEEKRQKQFQGILNKITPDNFERLTEKILEEIGITEQRTLEGLIDKIFDKALTDMHFCELYARMCKELSNHPKCPKFDNQGPGGKPLDLRRLLLYKCQEEFEKGFKAMNNMAEREAKEAADGGQQGAGDKEREEGEIPPEAGSTGGAEDPRVDERAAAAEDRAARLRMLGNIQFIGHLYKNGLITERILHSCIQALLREEKNPRPEDIECLAKLLTTVGAQLDSTQKQEYQVAMAAYFNRLTKLRYLEDKLDSRIRFMIQDVLDLRANRWVPRTKKEGPKKIEDVHKEAAQELAAQAARDRDEMRRGGRRDDRDRMGPPPSRSASNYDRLLSRDEVPSRAMQMQRAPSSELSLRPAGGGFGRAGRNPSPAVAGPGGRATPPPQLAATQAAAAAATAAVVAAAPLRGPSPFSGIPPTPVSEAPSRQASEALPTPKALSKAQTRTSVESSVKEFFTTTGQDVGEMVTGFADLRRRGADMASLLPLTLCAALEQRGIEMNLRVQPFVGVFKEALSRPLEEGGLSEEELRAGAAQLAQDLHLLMDDQPKAPRLLGPVLADFTAPAGPLSLEGVLRAVLAVPPTEDDITDPPLVDAGGAKDLLIALLTRLVALHGEEAAVAAWKASGLDAASFWAEFERDQAQADAQKASLAFLFA